MLQMIMHFTCCYVIKRILKGEYKVCLFLSQIKVSYYSFTRCACAGQSLVQHGDDLIG